MVNTAHVKTRKCSTWLLIGGAESSPRQNNTEEWDMKAHLTSDPPKIMFFEKENGLVFLLFCKIGSLPSESSILVGLESCFTDQKIQLHQHAELGQDAMGTC